MTPTTRFAIRTHSCQRELRASRRLCAEGVSFSRDLWRAWRTPRRLTVEVHHVRRSGEGRGLDKVAGKGLSPGRPTSFRCQRQPVDDCSPGRGEMAQDSGTRGETFHGEIDRCREVRAGLWRAVNMPEHDGKDQGRDNPKQACSC